MSSVAPFLFFAGIILQGVCGVRLFVRAAKLNHALFGSGPSWDGMTEWIVSIRLRNTFVLEVFGLPAGLAMTVVAITFLENSSTQR